MGAFPGGRAFFFDRLEGGADEILESLYARKSVRVFAEQPVDPALKAALFAAAGQAPTAGNQQLYTILDIIDPAKKERLAALCDHQGFIAKAPVVLVFCADCRRWLLAYREAGASPRAPGLGDALLSMADAVIAAQNAVVAAESLGLGSCYIGDVLENAEQTGPLLGLPDYVFPAAMLVLGWPAPGQRDRQKPARLPQKFVVQANTYRDFDGGETREMMAKNLGQRSFEDWVQAFCARKYNSDFSAEMSRSAAVWLEKFQTPGL